MSEKFQSVVEQLGKPEYSSKDVAVYQGDCLNLMSRLHEPAVDLTVTSPPYNIGKEYEEKLSLNAYISWCEEWISEVHRISNSRASFWLNLGYVPVDGLGKAVPLPYLLWDKNPFYMLQEIVWHYEAGVSARKTFSPRNEKFLWYVRDASNYTFNLDSVRDPNVKYPNQMKNGKLRCNPLGKNPGDVWKLPKVTSGKNRSSPERMPHPAQFPEAVIERIILASSNAGDIVFDPFGGSGTTAVVARRLGRKCITFEIRPDYVATSIKRLTTLQSMFGGINDRELLSVH